MVHGLKKGSGVGKQRTKDEHYIICLYEEAQKSGHIETPLNRYAVGEIAHLQARAVDAICKLLIQANFIKKSGEEEVYLTKHGESLVQRLLSE